MGNETSCIGSTDCVCRKDAHAAKTAKQKIIKADNIHLNGVYCLFSIFQLRVVLVPPMPICDKQTKVIFFICNVVAWFGGVYSKYSECLMRSLLRISKILFWDPRKKKTVLPKIRAACATISRTAIYVSCMVKS